MVELREHWFDSYQAEANDDTWENPAVDADTGDWEW